MICTASTPDKDGQSGSLLLDNPNPGRRDPALPAKIDALG
jgi:hypothetical protein